MSDTQLRQIDEFLSFFEATFEHRPGMLGTAVEVNAMFYVFDQIAYLRRTGSPMDYETQSWNAFLIARKYIKQGHNLLVKELESTPSSFSVLQELRREYAEWLEKPE